MGRADASAPAPGPADREGRGVDLDKCIARGVGVVRRPCGGPGGRDPAHGRAHGGCLGARSRRRAWQTAKSLGEPSAGEEPGMPECGNAQGVIPLHAGRNP